MKNLQNVKIERIGYGGIGISTTNDGKKILIKGGAIPGSIVDINITKKHSDYLEGHIAKVHEYDKSYLDGEIFCPHFFSTPFMKGGQRDSNSQNNEIPSLIKNEHGNKSAKIGCGGCKRQLISYPKQLELKQGIVQDCFRKMEDKPTFLPIVPSPKDKGYRNKIEFSFGVYISAKEGIDNKWNLGFHKQGEFSKIIDVDNCGLISDKMNQVFEYLKKLCFESGLPTFDQKFHRGFFRHLVIREGNNTGQLLINLNVFPILDDDIENKQKRDNLKDKLKLDEFIQKNVSTFVVTYNSGLADIVRGQDISTETLRGDGFIYEELQFTDNETNDTISAKFRISPFSFFQTNTHGAERLFATGMQNIGEIKGKILDLYCGAGSIGISFLKSGIGEELLGIEIVPEAIQDARHNAEINGIKDQCKFIASAAEKILLPDNKDIKNQENFELSNIGLVIVDPPREGLHTNVINRIANLKKTNNFKLLYISCNPTTMARDIELFNKLGFKLNSLQPVDMFPQTHHIETVGVLL